MFDIPYRIIDTTAKICRLQGRWLLDEEQYEALMEIKLKDVVGSSENNESKIVNDITESIEEYVLDYLNIDETNSSNNPFANGSYVIQFCI